VVPDALPDGFEWDEAKFVGYHYDDSNTWEYSITYENSALKTDEGRYALPPGGFRIYTVHIRCYEPEHEPPKDAAGYNLSSEHKIQDFEMRLKDALIGNPRSLMDIEGTQAVYSAYSGKTSTGEAPYLYSGSACDFMHGGILYTVSVRVYAHGDEDYEAFRAYAKETTEVAARSMLG
jgi:hypothetical protein